MKPGKHLYCLDSSALINAWTSYYSPSLCPSYWEALEELGKQGKVFIPALVKKEIDEKTDELSRWLKDSLLPVRPITEPVTRCWQEILRKDKSHQTLVDNIRGRSIADPWVIAHALNEHAIVVTKEAKETNPSAKRVRIPNVCEAMGLEWIDDFEFIERVGLRFACEFSERNSYYDASRKQVSFTSSPFSIRLQVIYLIL